MDKYELDITPDDIGEIIEMIRVQHLRLHAQPFSKKIGIKESLLLTVEEGKGPHGFLVLKKINDAYKNINVTIKVEVK